MIRLALLVDSPSKRAHGNAATRLAAGLVETGGVEPTLVCYGDDPAPPWLPPEVRIHRLGTGRVTRSLPGMVRYLRTEQPDVLITRQVHANFVGLAASRIARTPSGWHGKLLLVQDHPVGVLRQAWRLLVGGFVETLLVDVDSQRPRGQFRSLFQGLGIRLWNHAHFIQVGIQPHPVPAGCLQILPGPHKRPRPVMDCLA